MKKTITKIPIFYNSLRLSLMAAILGLPLSGFNYIFSLCSVNPDPPSYMVFITVPVIMAATVFVLAMSFAVIYNVTSKLIGGIEVEVDSD